MFKLCRVRRKFYGQSPDLKCPWDFIEGADYSLQFDLKCTRFQRYIGSVNYPISINKSTDLDNITSSYISHEFSQINSPVAIRVIEIIKVCRTVHNYGLTKHHNTVSSSVNRTNRSFKYIFKFYLCCTPRSSIRIKFAINFNDHPLLKIILISCNSINRYSRICDVKHNSIDISGCAACGINPANTDPCAPNSTAGKVITVVSKTHWSACCKCKK